MMQLHSYDNWFGNYTAILTVNSNCIALMIAYRNELIFN